MKATWLLPLALILATASCGLGLSRRSPGDGAASAPAEVAVPPAAPVAPPPADLAEVDTTRLSARERETWWRLVSRMYAPCPEHAVTLAVCLDEKRDCSACGPMAEVLAEQVHRGSSADEAERAAKSRFAPEGVQAVPLRDAPQKGAPVPLVTIVVFSDFQCPACKATLPLLEEVAAKYPGEVRLAHKFYPLPKHTLAKGAAYAAVAAQRQGKYWQMERMLFANQGALSEKDLEGYAAELGLDMARFRADVRDPAVHALVERDKQDGEAVGLTHTPYVLINGRLFDPSYFRWDADLEPWVRTEIAMSRAPKAPASRVIPAPSAAPGAVVDDPQGAVITDAPRPSAPPAPPASR